jgi:hypothetical protein
VYKSCPSHVVRGALCVSPSPLRLLSREANPAHEPSIHREVNADPRHAGRCDCLGFRVSGLEGISNSGKKS